MKTKNEIPLGGKNVKIGEKFRCPQCGTIAVKQQHNQQFCVKQRRSDNSSVCKNLYHGKRYDHKRQKQDKRILYKRKKMKEIYYNSKREHKCPKCGVDIIEGSYCELCKEKMNVNS